MKDYPFYEVMDVCLECGALDSFKPKYVEDPFSSGYVEIEECAHCEANAEAARSNEQVGFDEQVVYEKQLAEG